jgi:hypothetical protein
MRAILLDITSYNTDNRNSVLIADVCDVKLEKMEIKCKVICEYYKSFTKLELALLIFEDLSHKYLYGVLPMSDLDDGVMAFTIDHIIYGDKVRDRTGIHFNIYPIEKEWLKHNRNTRIDEILLYR